MNQQEYFNKIDSLGIKLSSLYIVIGRCSGMAGVHGIYEKNGQWIYYSADDRNHIDEDIIGSEQEAFDEIYEYTFAALDMQGYLSTAITEDIVSIDKQTVCQFICRNYAMSEQKANDMWDKLKQDMHVLFEFKYYVAHNEFVPETYCYKRHGYSAEQLYKTTSLTVLGAYNYMIYLYDKPQEALANLEKGLLRK